MKFAVYGAGSIGGFLGCRLIEAGHDVSLIARGAHLAAIREKGLLIRSAELGESRYSPPATEDPADIGPVDYVILGVKAQALPAIAPSVPALFHDDTVLVTMQNGLPWWHFHGFEGDEPGLESVDPGGVIERYMPSSRVVGGIAYISCSMPEPGVIEHSQGLRFPVGEPDRSRTERAKNLSDALQAGGIKSPVRNDIRHEIWAKLLGNAVFNPLSALTRKTMIEMLDYRLTYELMRAGMYEVREVASAVGVQIAFSPEQRLEGAKSAGAHKTSMLQDLEAGRSPELDPILGSVLELAERKSVPAPTLRTLYAAAKLLFETSLKH